MDRELNDLGSTKLAVSAGSLLVLCFYAVYVVVHITALKFGTRWLHSRTRVLQSRPANPTDLPPVSIIKPIIGCDPNLRVNLETFFRLDYPNYELLFCLAEADASPSLPLVTQLMNTYPSVEARVFQGIEMVGVNPKINNMIPAYRAAKYDLLWICDSSIITPPHTLRELVSHIGHPQVALVHQLPYVAPTRSFADCLDKVYFGTQHSRVYLVANWLGQNCANGMSWLIRRRALEDEGGLQAFSDYLAEDFFIGKALWERGWKLALSTLPALQNPGLRSLASYQARVIRWGRLRNTMMPWPGLVEPLTECLGLGLAGALAARQLLGVSVLLFLLVHTSFWLLCDMMLIRIIQNGPVGPLWQVLLAWLLRELWTLPLFLAGLCSLNVVWKGIRYRIRMGGKTIRLN